MTARVDGVIDTEADALDRTAAALIDLLGREGECSLPRLCKRLGLARSELQRLLLVLSGSAGAGEVRDANDAVGGLGLIDQREAGGRTLVALSARGLALLGIGR